MKTRTKSSTTAAPPRPSEETMDSSGGFVSTTSSKMEVLFKFTQGQKVFCQHDEEMYNSHVIQRIPKDGQPYYKIHYHGRNRTWDEVVPEDNVWLYNEASIRIYQRMKQDKKELALKKAEEEKMKKQVLVPAIVSSKDELAPLPSISTDDSSPTKDSPTISTTEKEILIPETNLVSANLTKKARKRKSRSHLFCMTTRKRTQSAISKLSARISLLKSMDAAQSQQPVAITKSDDQFFQFSVGQEVLCFHGPLLYLAKCDQRELRQGKPCYLVHYYRWSSCWDQWVDESQLRHRNPENVKLSNELLKAHKQKTKARARRVASAESVPITAADRDRFRYWPDRADQRVLCYYGPQLYLARVIDMKLAPILGVLQPHYLMHYIGWNKIWDNWVAEDQVIPFTEENVALANRIRDELNSKQLASPAPAIKYSVSVPEGNAATTKEAGKRTPKRKASSDKKEANKKIKKTTIESTPTVSPKKTRSQTRKLLP